MRKRIFGYAIAGMLAVVMVLATTPAGAQIIQGSGMGAGITKLDFSVTTPTLGLVGSAVFAEALAAPPENTDADWFWDAAYPPPPFSNFKFQDDNAVLGYASPPEKPDDMDGITFNFADQPPITMADPETSAPYKFVQFSVDRLGLGLPGTAVNSEAVGLPTSPEAAGDVFQGPSPVVGQNVLISDEDAQGLVAPPGPFGMDDLDALDLNDMPAGPSAVLYSLSGKYPITLINTLPPNPPGCGADIWLFGGTTWSDHLELNLAGWLTIGPPPHDDIDALFVCPWSGGPPGAYAVFFSLAPGSPTLWGANPFLPGGCDPGDILRVNCLPGSRAPGLGPFIVVHAATIGLFGDGIPNPGLHEDNLDALDMSLMPYGEVSRIDNWMMY